MNSNSADDAQKILEQRAEKLAQATDTETQREVAETVVVVTAGPETFGLPIRGVREIMRAPKVARLELPKPWLMGIAQVRGEVVSVIDLPRLLGVGTLRTRNPLLALVEGPPGQLGVLFDEVVDVREIYRDEVSSDTLLRERFATKPILGATRDLVVIIDTGRLFSSDDVVVDLRTTEEDVGK